MTALASLKLAQRGLTISEVQFMGHLVDCRGTWKLENRLTPDTNGNGTNGAPLARLMGKLGCTEPGDLEALLRELADG